MSETKTKDWEEVAKESCRGYTAFELERKGERWRITVRHTEVINEIWETEGRGDSPEAACEAVRKDIFAWCEDNELQRANYATALRNLCYTAEDAE